MMTSFDALPSGPGTFRVETSAGTVHIIIRQDGRLTWERRPAEGTYIGRYDGEAIHLSLLGDGWVIGGTGYLEVADSSYLEGGTWHRTGQIVSICTGVQE